MTAVCCVDPRCCCCCCCNCHACVLLPARYDKAVVEEQELPPEKRVVANVGKMDAKKHIAAAVTSLMSSNINQAMGTMLDTVVF